MRWATLFFLTLVPAASAAPSDTLSSLEAALVDEVNKLRQDPQGYASYLDQQTQHYRGNVLAFPGAPRIRTAEGREALEEAIRDLRSMTPVSPLALSGGLCQAARDHVEDQGLRGAVGHTGTDRSDASARASRYSQYPARVGENIIYGANDAAWILLRFLADHGIPNRGHRKNLLDPRYQFLGVACGPHAAYEGMCVLDFARQYADQSPIARNRRSPSAPPASE